MRDFQLPGRSVVMGANGMVATSQPMATQAGLAVLQRGGNALDAAITAGAVICVTEAGSTGIGGDCFILYHEAATGKLHGLNGSGRTPARATVAEYRARGLTEMPKRGILSVTVPGAIDAWGTALERFGTIGLGEALEPAIAFAEEGYAVSPMVARKWQAAEEMLAAHPDSRRALLVDGRAPAAGTKHRQPELAASLRLIATEGRRAFYEGRIAERIVQLSREQDGLLELDDLAAHRSDWVEPIHTDYRGIRLCEIPPNGQGITALMTLNILEHARLGEMEHLGPDHVHAFAEAFRLAVAERDTYVSDLGFNEVPVAALLAKDFAARQYGRIDPARALAHPLTSALHPAPNTIYLSVVDRDRNCCSFINSLYKGFGSGLVAGDTGIVLQNRGWDFVLDEGHFNAMAPRKRPMHTIIPAMAYRGDQPVLCFGVMGGDFQALGHSYVLSNWLDFGMDLQEAVDAPRFQALKGRLEVERGVPGATREALAARGHTVVDVAEPLGGAQLIYIDAEAGVLQAASDPRKDGLALGY